MATNLRRAGVAYLTIDGTAYDVAGDLAYDPTLFNREGLIGQSGPQGFKEMHKFGVISCKIRDAGNMTVGEFNNLTDSTIVCRLANGKTVSGSNMFQTGEIKVDSAEGTFDVTFNGYVEES